MSKVEQVSISVVGANWKGALGPLPFALRPTQDNPIRVDAAYNIIGPKSASHAMALKSAIACGDKLIWVEIA